MRERLVNTAGHFAPALWVIREDCQARSPALCRSITVLRPKMHLDQASRPPRVSHWVRLLHRLHVSRPRQKEVTSGARCPGLRLDQKASRRLEDLRRLKK